MRGTTPTHKFKVPIDTSNIARAMVIYAQNDVELFHKETTDCVFLGEEIRVTLTQEDTLKFSHMYPVQIQLRVRTNDGQALKTGVILASVGKCLNDEVL